MDKHEKKQAKRFEKDQMSLAFKVGRMGRLMHRFNMVNAHRHGAIGDPTRGQGRVLALLAVKPKTTQRELSYLLDMRQQSLSELLAKLEEKGYITREKSEEDGRVTVVELTEEGRAAAPSPEDMSQRPDGLECLDDEERTELETLVDKVTSSLEEKLVALGDDPYAPPRRPHGEHGPHRERGRGEGRGPQGHGWDPRRDHLRQA
ncbi:MAG: MarR family transcriptional regulator [Atopobiaceae bacterium]|nr:MarR family transcriptional regulator [Atopobiaceae bacterium]